MFFVEVGNNSTTLTYILYSAKGSLSHRLQMGSNTGLEAKCITLKLRRPSSLDCLGQILKILIRF